MFSPPKIWILGKIPSGAVICFYFACAIADVAIDPIKIPQMDIKYTG